MTDKITDHEFYPAEKSQIICEDCGQQRKYHTTYWGGNPIEDEDD